MPLFVCLPSEIERSVRASTYRCLLPILGVTPIRIAGRGFPCGLAKVTEVYMLGRRESKTALAARKTIVTSLGQVDEAKDVKGKYEGERKRRKLRLLSSVHT